MAKSVNVLFILIFSVQNTALAGVYKWVDANGKTHFSDSAAATVKAEQIEVTPQNIVHAEKSTPNSEAGKTVEAEKPVEQSSTKSFHAKKHILMYSASWCGYCKKARHYFEENHLAFKELDVETSAKGKAEYNKLGGGGIPIIFVNKDKMVGFNEQQFQQLYDR